MNHLGVTNNYGKFELLKFNRDVERTARLEESMKRYGYIAAYPLHVTTAKNGKFTIKAGHHRFYAARKLGIPVYYVVCDDQASIFELEESSNRWSVNDYLSAHAREGKNPDYLKVREYCDETGICINNAISLLGGHTAGTGNFQKPFKQGTFRIKKGCDKAEIIKDIVLHAKRCGVSFYNNTLFVQAVSRVIWVEDFSVFKFKSKIKSFAAIMEKKANLQQYLDLIEDIYNRQSRDKIPLAFMAAKKAKERNVVGISKRK